MKPSIINFSIFFVLFWLFSLWYILSNKNQLNFSNLNDIKKLQQKIKQADKILSNLETKNRENEILIRSLRNEANFFSRKKNLMNSNLYPSENFESIRRKIFDDINDLSFFVKNKFLLKNNSLLEKQILSFEKDFQDRINFLLVQMENLSISDNLEEWRKIESDSLAFKVQSHFHSLQNPDNCSKQKKAICNLNKSCGFGCQMHHVMYCFITSYFLNRTLILDSTGWRYDSNGFEAYFKPLSEKCTKINQNAEDWNGNQFETADVIRLPIIDEITNKPEFFPLSVPKKYLSSLKRFHGDPFVWWSGQILSYLMRFNEHFSKIVQDKHQKLGFQAPCVGVHVRRTDKLGTEASFHALSEYMNHVNDFFDIYDLKTSKKNLRRVYLASDDLSVLYEAKKDYPEYIFIMDEVNAQTASINNRYSPESAQGIVLDIFFLSSCDYLVCTLSSQVCRLAYEIQQTRFPDASWRFRSLDDIYYFGGQLRQNVIAVLDHNPKSGVGEIELKKGDILGIAGNHWNGYSKGKNLRTQEEGLFPSYKVKKTIDSF